MEKYARKCDVTGEVFNEGFLVDGHMKIMYVKDESDMLAIALEAGYKDLEESYRDEFHYWTEWDPEEEDGYYTENGEYIEVQEEGQQEEVKLTDNDLRFLIMKCEEDLENYSERSTKSDRIKQLKEKLELMWRIEKTLN